MKKNLLETESKDLWHTIPIYSNLILEYSNIDVEAILNGVRCKHVAGYNTSKTYVTCKAGNLNK